MTSKKAGAMFMMKNGNTGARRSTNRYPNASFAKPSASLAANGPARLRKTSPKADFAARKIAADPVVAAMAVKAPPSSQPNRKPENMVRIEAAGKEKATASA